MERATMQCNEELWGANNCRVKKKLFTECGDVVWDGVKRSEYKEAYASGCGGDNHSGDDAGTAEAEAKIMLEQI